MALTLTEAVRAYIIADGTLAAKVGNSTYPGIIPQGFTGADAAVIKIVTGPLSFMTLLGATDAANVRVEVTFWSKLYHDAEVSANRLRTIVAGFVGTMGTGGVKVSVFQTVGPRSAGVHPDSHYFGMQLDILATVDMSTAA